MGSFLFHGMFYGQKNPYELNILLSNVACEASTDQYNAGVRIRDGVHI